MNCEEFQLLTSSFGRRLARFGAADDESSPVWSNRIVPWP